MTTTSTSETIARRREQLLARIAEVGARIKQQIAELLARLDGER